jgi:hypothetical protein
MTVKKVYYLDSRHAQGQRPTNIDPARDRKIDQALALLIARGLVYTEVNRNGEVVYKARKTGASRHGRGQRSF